MFQVCFIGFSWLFEGSFKDVLTLSISGFLKKGKDGGGGRSAPLVIWLSEGIFIIFFKQGSCLGCKGPDFSS